MRCSDGRERERERERDAGLQDSQEGVRIVVSFVYEGEAKAGGSGGLRKCDIKTFNKASSSITEPPFPARLWNAFGAFP
jgi:hypothetical protein